MFALMKTCAAPIYTIAMLRLRITCIILNLYIRIGVGFQIGHGQIRSQSGIVNINKHKSYKTPRRFVVIG